MEIYTSLVKTESTNPLFINVLHMIAQVNQIF